METQQQMGGAEYHAGYIPGDMSPAQIKLAQAQNQLFEDIVLKQDLTASVQVGKMKISPYEQALARATQEGKTEWIKFLKSPEELETLKEVYKTSNEQLAWTRWRMVEPDVSGLWLDIRDYVQDTMWKMFTEGRSWTGESLENIVIYRELEESAHVHEFEDFLYDLEEYLNKAH